MPHIFNNKTVLLTETLINRGESNMHRKDITL